MSVSLYFDEDVDANVATALRKQGYDVLTTTEAGNNACTDRSQLEFAASRNRVLVTCNVRDFVRLHTQVVSSGAVHHGIIVARHTPAGETIRRLAKLLSVRTSQDMINQLEFLSSWK